MDKAGSWADRGARPPGGEEEVTTRLGRGRRLGRYRLIQLIRRGRRTELYRGERSVDGAQPVPCAVKIVRAELEASLDAARELSHEIQVLSQLDHPNVVRLEDHGNVAGTTFMALEYLDGRSVSRLLHALSLTGGWMPADVAAHVAAEVALALAHVHHATIGSLGPTELVHRDVRPGHVMLLRTGAVKLIDFGAARGADRRLGRRRTQMDLGAGTAAYLAPEQVQGHPVDRRADLFSLGVVLWEMLAQRRLFRRETDQETASAVVEAPIPALSSLRSDIPVALEAAVRRALERDPQHRYQTAEEMAADLGRCTPGRESMARGVSVLVEATMEVGGSGFSPLPARPPGPPRRLAGGPPPASAAEKTMAVRRWRPWWKGFGDPRATDRSRLRIIQAGALATLAFAAGALWQRRRLERAQARRAVAPAPTKLPPVQTPAPVAAPRPVSTPKPATVRANVEALTPAPEKPSRPARRRRSAGRKR